MYKLEFYVPVANAERVKEALFAVGCGSLGDYSRCCWQTNGLGQFTCGKNSNPAIGSAGSSEVVEEVKVEMLIATAKLAIAAVGALTKAHPYETPAYFLTKSENIQV